MPMTNPLVPQTSPPQGTLTSPNNSGPQLPQGNIGGKQLTPPPGRLAVAGHILKGVLTALAGGQTPQYTVGPDGTMTKVPQHGSEFKSMFGGILAGALTGLAAGANTNSPGAAIGAGFVAAQNRFMQEDQMARQNAMRQFQMKQQAAQQKETAEYRQKQLQNAQTAATNSYKLGLMQYGLQGKKFALEAGEVELAIIQNAGGTYTVANIPHNGEEGNESFLKQYFATHPTAFKDPNGLLHMYMPSPTNSHLILSVTYDPNANASITYRQFNKIMPPNKRVPIPEGKTPDSPMPPNQVKTWLAAISASEKENLENLRFTHEEKLQEQRHTYKLGEIGAEKNATGIKPKFELPPKQDLFDKLQKDVANKDWEGAQLDLKGLGMSGAKPGLLESNETFYNKAIQVLNQKGVGLLPWQIEVYNRIKKAQEAGMTFDQIRAQAEAAPGDPQKKAWILNLINNAAGGRK